MILHKVCGTGEVMQLPGSSDAWQHPRKRIKGNEGITFLTHLMLLMLKIIILICPHCINVAIIASQKVRKKRKEENTFSHALARRPFSAHVRLLSRTCVACLYCMCLRLSSVMLLLLPLRSAWSYLRIYYLCYLSVVFIVCFHLACSKFVYWILLSSLRSES